MGAITVRVLDEDARDESAFDESIHNRDDHKPPRLDSQGTVLITGGTGALGRVIARHLIVEHGVGHVLLASRRGPDAEDALALEAQLESLGARVTLAACDVADYEQVNDLLQSVPTEFPLRGIVHTAGILDDGVLESLTTERVDRVLAAKADAAWHLHELTKHLDLAMFVLFSSAAGTLGGWGQGNYAAANAFLDALAANRRAQGLAGISMAWGKWNEASGMTGHLSELDQARMSRAGVGGLSSEEGLALFDAALDAGEALVLPVRLEITALRAQARIGALPAIFGGLVRVPVRRANTQVGASLASRLAAIPEVEREGVILDLVRAQVAVVLGHSSPEAVPEGRAFKEARVRFARCGGVAQPPEYSHGPAYAQYACVRLPNRSRCRRLCAGRGAG